MLTPEDGSFERIVGVLTTSQSYGLDLFTIHDS